MRGDLEPADLVPVDLVVIAAVGVQIPGAAQWPAALAADRRDGLDQRDQLGDVVAVAAGGDCRERDAVRLDDQMVLAAGLAPVHRGRTGGRPALHRAVEIRLGNGLRDDRMQVFLRRTGLLKLEDPK